MLSMLYVVAGCCPLIEGVCLNSSCLPAWMHMCKANHMQLPVVFSIFRHSSGCQDLNLTKPKHHVTAKKIKITCLSGHGAYAYAKKWIVSLVNGFLSYLLFNLASSSNIHPTRNLSNNKLAQSHIKMHHVIPIKCLSMCVKNATTGFPCYNQRFEVLHPAYKERDALVVIGCCFSMIYSIFKLLVSSCHPELNFLKYFSLHSQHLEYFVAFIRTFYMHVQMDMPFFAQACKSATCCLMMYMVVTIFVTLCALKCTETCTFSNYLRRWWKTILLFWMAVTCLQSCPIANILWKTKLNIWPRQ